VAGIWICRKHWLVAGIWICRKQWLVAGIWICRKQWIVTGIWICRKQWLVAGIWICRKQWLVAGIWICRKQWLVADIWICRKQWLVTGIWICLSFKRESAASDTLLRTGSAITTAACAWKQSTTHALTLQDLMQTVLCSKQRHFAQSLQPNSEQHTTAVCHSLANSLLTGTLPFDAICIKLCSSNSVV
jgi:hypothetical protein